MYILSCSSYYGSNNNDDRNIGASTLRKEKPSVRDSLAQPPHLMCQPRNNDNTNKNNDTDNNSYSLYLL